MSRESTRIGWLSRRVDGVTGVIESSSCRLRCEPNVVVRGVVFSACPPSRPALLMVLTFRVMPAPPSCPFCSRCLLLLIRRNRMTPTIASRPTTPPATPPAIAPTSVDDLLESWPVEAAGIGVMTTVRVMTMPLSVTSVGTVTGCSVAAGESFVEGFLVVGFGDGDDGGGGGGDDDGGEF